MAKSLINRKKAAKEFADFWKNRGDEKQDTQAFWTSLLRDVFGVAKPEQSIEFEKKIQLRHTSFIDAYIPETKVLIEQKSSDVDLRKEAKQSDGAMLTPFRQAKRYADEMPNSLRPNWIVVCNFQEFLIYDMEKPHDEPVQILLKDLPNKFDYLQFIADTKKSSISPEEQVSLKAGELVGKLYDALIKEYINPDENSLRSLNILCVRIVFCLYAEDAGLFETRTSFEDYIKSFSLENLRRGLMDLFKILNTKPENRDKYDTKINSFPYVNGGLFADDTIEIPNFTKEIVDILVDHCAPFDWSEISPTIFGAVFESTLNPETRRKGGMHYTSIKNIHRVIDPLFLDDLRAEFKKIVEMSHGTSQKVKIEQLRNKIASLTFLDPACGSGNFLTETYISLRRLENEILKNIYKTQYGTQTFVGHGGSPISVKISQFYGIEINDFAVTVAKTALWIAESQMMKETEKIVDEDLDFLPLSTSATIVEGNALHMDWSTLEEEKNEKLLYADKLNLYRVDEKAADSTGEPEIPYGAHFKELNVAAKEITEKRFPAKEGSKPVIYDYIIGNPPFVGFTFMSSEQKKDLDFIFPKIKNLDYVCCWYKKASDLIQGKQTRCAFVSTNSITQGETVARFFPALHVKYDFAWRTFEWENETSDKRNMAAVHCVIIGFSCRSESAEKQCRRAVYAPTIFNNDGTVVEAKNINPYLLDAPNIVVSSRSKPLCSVSQMIYGNKPADGGYLIIEEEEYDDFIRKDPAAKKFVRPLLGAVEFLHNKKRYCLWLVKATPAEIKNSPLVFERVKKCKASRENSIAAGIRKFAETPHLFAQRTQPEGVDYIIVPRVSSENRRYVPIGFMRHEIIVNDAVQIIPNATLYHFGILTSSVHNAWMRAVCGRLESRYRYSKDIVYNNFPWCNPTETQKTKIEQTAQAILDARAKYPDSSLADLYDETTMPPDLRKAHKENDKAVLAAYGFSPKMSEAEIVAELFSMYEKMIVK